MRIPLHKVYRAFPELDRFDDENCARFVVQARRVSVEKRIGRHLLEFAASAGVFIVVLVVGVAASSALASMRVSRLTGEVALVVFVSAIAALPIIAGMMVRDAWLRRAIAARLASARCAACDYSLLGLPVKDEMVMCPECGFELELEKYGLRPEDILSPAGGEREEARDHPAAGPRMVQ